MASQVSARVAQGLAGFVQTGGTAINSTTTEIVKRSLVLKLLPKVSV